MIDGVDFKIKAPIAAGIFCWIVTVASVLLLIAGAILLIAGIPVSAAMGCLIGGGCGCVCGVILFYVYKVECFKLENGSFYYIKPFRKSQTAKVEDIHHVAVYAIGLLKHVYFYDKDNKTLLSFLDDRTSFFSGEFERALAAYGIPIFYQ